MASRQSTFLKIGNVIKADETWSITAIDSRSGALSINQNTKYIGSFEKGTQRIVTDRNGVFVALNAMYRDTKIASLEDVLAKKKIERKTLSKKFFIVTKTGMEGGGTGHGPYDIYPDGWHIYAKECNATGKITKGGLKIEFYQSGAFNCMVKKPVVVGNCKVDFANFTPRARGRTLENV